MKILIVGAGKLGVKVAAALLSSNHDITIIDTNETQLNRIALQLDVMTVGGNGKEIKVLNSINISSFDCLIATTGNDETNIVISSLAKELGCKRVLARIRDPEHMDQFDYIKSTFKIDHVVNPDMSITQEIFKYLSGYSFFNSR